MPGGLVVSGYQSNPRSRSLADVPASAGAAFGAAFATGLRESPVAATYRMSRIRAQVARGRGLGSGLGIQAQGLVTGFANIDRFPGADAPADLPTTITRDQVGVILKDYGLEPDVFAEEMGDRERFDLNATLLLAEAKRAERNRQGVIARGSNGFFRTTGVFAAQILGAMTDPVNIAVSFLPVGTAWRYSRSAASVRGGWNAPARSFRESWRASTLEAQLAAQNAGALGRFAARASEGALEGAAGAALVEPLTLGAATMEASDYTIGDSLMAVSMGAVMGGGLHAGMGAISDALVKLRRTKPNASVVEAAALAEPEGRMSEAIMQASPETRMAAAQHTLAAMADGRKFDPETIYRAMGEGDRTPTRVEIANADPRALTRPQILDELRELGAPEGTVARLADADDATLGNALQAVRAEAGLEGRTIRIGREEFASPEALVDRIAQLVEARKFDQLSDLGLTEGRARLIIESDQPAVAATRHVQGLQARANERVAALRPILGDDVTPEQFDILVDEMRQQRFETPEDVATWAESQFAPENQIEYDGQVQETLRAAREAEQSAGDIDAARAQREAETYTQELELVDPEGAEELRIELAALDDELARQTDISQRLVNCMLGVSRG